MATQVPQPEAPSTPDQTAAAGQKTVETVKASAAPETDEKEKAVAEPKSDGGPPQVSGDGKPATPPEDTSKLVATKTRTVVDTDDTSVTTPARRNSHAKVDRFFALRDRLPIQILNEETWIQKFGHWGPVVMGAASVLLTLFVWQGTKTLTNKQIELDAQQVALQKQQVALQSQQTKLQNDQIEAELADLRFKFLNDLTATDENKKTPAEISLAAHGLKAFPVVHSALGVEQGDIRRSAVNVVYRLFQAEAEAGRKELLKKLEGEFTFPNQILHTGVVQSFVKIEPLLNPEQRKNIITFLQEKVVPQTVCSDQEGRETVFQATLFIGSKRADAIPYLISIVNVPKCGDAWLQAMLDLQLSAAKMSTQERADLREKITQLKRELLDRLELHVSMEELAAGGGFASFANKGAFTIEFGDLKKRIEKEFDTLISQLG